ncbi:MAG TPA: hypothetical protein VFH68_06025 [Polyangia bacterium]|jgi:photosystem II stability/assembly factor-like uncharacterized protein|nr:hypothetical protein [Polyangia bacterium]
MKHAPTLFRVAGFCVAFVVPALGVAPRRARANEAFPNSLGLLLPPDRPDEIILAATFGIVLSEDAGQTWTYTCEHLGNFGMTIGQYQLGAVPRDRLFALTDKSFLYSDDRSCTWASAQGMVTGKPLFDYFPDPGNPDRVWAARGPDLPDAGTNQAYSILESTDGGATFGTVRYTAAVGDTINGVEIARSDGNTAYLTMRGVQTLIPKLAVTQDGGASWTIRDLSARFGNASLRIIAIDPSNAGKIFLRVTTTGANPMDAIAVSLDGGASFVTPNPLSVPDGVLTSFVRMPSGTLLVGGIKVVTNVIYRSTNGGVSFQELPSPTVRGLAQRAGRAYVATDNEMGIDGYALGVSDDEGTSWQPLMSYDQIQAISACARSICQSDCVLKANFGTWDESVCTADPSPQPVDGGARDGATMTDARADAGAVSPPGAGCGCRAGLARHDGPAAGLASLLLAVLLARRRARRPAR